MPMIKLLSFSTSRFETNICLTQLFKNHRSDYLFPVKNEVVSCLSAISANRILQKHQREFFLIFSRINNEINIDYLEKGYVQLIITMGNFVLKDLSVNLSVKEVALQVIEGLLKSQKVEDIELVRVTINLMKSSYNSKNLHEYLYELLRRLKPEYIALVI